MIYRPHFLKQLHKELNSGIPMCTNAAPENACLTLFGVEADFIDVFFNGGDTLLQDCSTE